MKTIKLLFKALIVSIRYKIKTIEADYLFRKHGVTHYVIPHNDKFVVANWNNLKTLANKRGAGSVQDIISTAVYTAK